jgi:hypothetical protein
MLARKGEVNVLAPLPATIVQNTMFLAVFQPKAKREALLPSIPKWIKLTHLLPLPLPIPEVC